MREELDKKLVEKYPRIFRNRYADMRTTCMCWGFCCGDGWYNILDALCGNIQHHIKWKRDQRARAIRHNRALSVALRTGNKAPLIKRLSYGTSPQQIAWATEQADAEIQRGRFRQVPDAPYWVTASQVKEKFGGLRFYYDGGDDIVSGMVRMAESMSYRTCEECGAPGMSNSYGWISTLCDTHRLARGEDLPQDEVEVSED